MPRQTAYLTVEREVNSDTVEYELEVSCEVEPFVRGRCSGPVEKCYPPEGGFAYIDGPVYMRNDDGDLVLWDGVLTEDEQRDAEREAYTAWLDSSEEDCDDDEALLDTDFDGPEISFGGRRVF
jgi:hypothetical protein